MDNTLTIVNSWTELSWSLNVRLTAIVISLLHVLVSAKAAVADQLIYQRAAQLIEGSPGQFRDVYDIFVTNTQSAFTTRLTMSPQDLEHDSAGAALNAAGDTFVFYTYRHRGEAGNDNSAELYTMASDGSLLTRLTTNAAIDDALPQWCGSFIVFSRDDYGTNNANDIYRINPDRSGLMPIVETTADEFEPDCHTASGKLVYVSAQTPADRKIVVSGLDGSNPVVLTSVAAVCGSPRWSPDGQWIYYQCDHHNPQTGQWEIYRMRPVDVDPSDGEGDDRERLTVSPAGSTAEAPVVSPDGNKVGYTRITGPEFTAFWKTIGTSDDAPIAALDGRTFLSDWR